MSNLIIDEFFKEHGQEIIDMRLSKMKVKDIADHFNMNSRTIDGFLQRNHIFITRLDDECKEKIIERYNNGESISKLCKEYHFGSGTISKLLKENNITVRDNRKYSLNEYYFDQIDNQDKAYIIGLLYADGCRSGASNAIIIRLQERDKEILDKINSLLDSNRPLRFIDYSNDPSRQNQYLLQIDSKHIADKLFEYGIVPNKEFKLKFPDFLPDELLPHFIRGYLDGDGCILKNEKRVALTGTEMLLSGIKERIEPLLNIHFSLYASHGKKERVTRDLRVSGSRQSKIFLDYIYQNANLYIQRKYDLYKTLYCSD